MNNIEYCRKRKIYEIVSIIKLATLFLCGVILFKYCYNNKDINIYLQNDFLSIFSIGTAIGVLLIIYGIWSLSFINNLSSKYIKIIQNLSNLIFILMFSELVIISGAYISQYKFLFLFIIITSTIESGKEYGIVIALISSVFILSVDLIYLPGAEVNQYFENDLILAGGFIVTALALGYYVKIEYECRSQIATLANIDGLTEVYNHRFFHDILKKEIGKGKKQNYSVSLVFIDIDYFKYYNDLYGHQRGDYVLKKIGFILRNSAGENGIPARYGGEEFAVILPNTSEQEAISVGEKIRHKVEKYKFEGEENQPNNKITVSIGICTFPEKAKTDVELLNRADEALYRAKFLNKNKVEVYYSILEDLKCSVEGDDIGLVNSIKTLINAISSKDKYTYGHSERVMMLCRLLENKLEITSYDKKILKYGAYIHDLGKINISRDILNKKADLTDEEREIIKQHVVNGVEIIKHVEALKDVIPLVLYHHERYDGKGYPEGLKGEEIPYLVRVLTVLDSFDAMTSNRIYSNRKSYDEAILELDSCKGTQFDPYIVDKFIKVMENNKDKLNSRILSG